MIEVRAIRSRKFSMLLSGLMLAVFMLLTAVAAGMKILDLSHKSYIAEFIFAALLFWLWLRLDGKNRFAAERGGAVRTGLILSAVFLAINLSYVLIFRLEPAGDYETFRETALSLCRSQEPANPVYLGLFPHILGYSAFLSIFLRIFGGAELTAPVINVLLGCATGIMLYRIILRRRGLKAAKRAYILWILCPSAIMYNAMVLSEPYYTCLLLVFLLIIELLEERGESLRPLGFLLAALPGGLMLAGINSARPIAAIPLIAFFIWLFLLRGEELHNKELWKRWLCFGLGLLLVFTLGGRLWKGWAEKLLGEKLPESPGYSFYVGFNTESGGSYSPEDSERLMEYRNGAFPSALETQQKMAEDARERIKAIKASEFPGFFAVKLRTLLGHDEGGAYYSFENSQSPLFVPFSAISNIYYYFLLLLVFRSCLRLMKRGESSALLLSPLYCIGLSLAHMLVEVSARYHYSIIPMLIIIAAAGSGKNQNTKGELNHGT